MRRIRAIIGFVAAMSCVALMSTQTQSRASPADEPWAKGVAIEQQKRAYALFQEGNTLINDLLFVQAAEKYKTALSLLEHPVIFFNLAIAQINQDQTIAAYDNLKRALQYGPGPLGEVKYDQGKTLQKALEGQLAQIELVCDVDGAEVILDDKLRFVGPGSQVAFVRAGPHNVLARKPGYIPTTRTVALAAGQTERVVLSLMPLGGTTRKERLMRRWIPVVIMTGGVALMAGGGYLDARSSSEFDRFDTAFEARCAPRGCADGEVPDLGRMLDDAEQSQLGAIALYSIGGVVFATGSVLLYLNREQIVIESNPRDVGAARRSRKISLQPMWSPDGLGVRLEGAF